MASKQIDGKPKSPYDPANLPPEAGQTGEYGDDSGLTSTEFDEPDSDYGQPPHGQPPCGQPPHGQPPHGQPPHGQPPYGQPPHGQPPHGQPPHGQPPHGQPPHGQPPHGQSPWDYDFPQQESQGGSDSDHELVCCSDRIVLDNNTQLPTMAKLAPDTIPKDHQYCSWEDFVKQSGENLNPGTTFKVSSDIYPGDTTQQKNPVEIYVRESFEGLFKVISTPTPSATDHSDRTAKSVAQSDNTASIPQKYVITGTQGVGTTAFGFYLLLRLVHMVSTGESILYRYTTDEGLKYVRITRDKSPSSSSLEYSNIIGGMYDESVTWFVSDLISAQSYPRQRDMAVGTNVIVIKPSPLNFRRSYPYTVLYMPLWEFEEIEMMLKTLHRQQYEKLQQRKEEKRNTFDRIILDLLGKFEVGMDTAQKKCLQIQQSSWIDLASKMKGATDQFSRCLDQWDIKWKINECKLQIDRGSTLAKMDRAFNSFKSTVQLENDYFAELKKLGVQFSEDISKLEEEYFPQLSDAKWAFKVCGCLPSEYLHTKDRRPEVEKELKSEVRSITCVDSEMRKVINLMQTSDPLPSDVNKKVLHVSCVYDGNKKPCFNKPILLEASLYTMTLLRQAEPKALAPFVMNFLMRHYALSANNHGEMFEDAAHNVFKEGTYQVHHLGTCKEPKNSKGETTLAIPFKRYKKVASKKNKNSITIKPEDEDCYCQPEEGFPVIDALIPSQKYLFQMTLRESHPVNTKCLMDILDCLKWTDKVDKVKLIFVVLKTKNADTFTAQKPESESLQSKGYNKMFAKIQQYRLALPQDPTVTPL